MNAVSLLRQQVKEGHEWLEAIMSDVTPEMAKWAPPGQANPLGASYAHVVVGEDMVVNGMLRRAATLFVRNYTAMQAVSEEPPQFPASWAEWARKVEIDLPKLREYAQALYASTDEYLASLSEGDLEKKITLPVEGMGEVSIAWMLSNTVLGHVHDHCGEISCLKGMQGAKGYPA